MEELFRKLLGKTVDTAVNAGIQSLVTGQDYGDAFKQQAGLAALTAISGKDSPLDFFRQQQTQPQSTAPASNVTVSRGSTAPTIQRRPVPRELTPEEKQQVEFLSVMKGVSEEEAKADLLPSLFPTEVKDVNVTDIDNRGIMESLGDLVTGDGGRMSALKQLFFPDPARS